MKESKSSLKVWFIVIGLLSLTLNLWSFASLGSNSLKAWAIMSIAISVAYSAAYIYIGVKMNTFLEKSPKLLIKLIIITTGIVVVLQVLSGNYYPVIVHALITWYLISNIKRITSTQRPPEVAK